MDIYNKALLDDTRNYTAMHYEIDRVWGSTSAVGFGSDPYLGFEAPLVPNFSVNKMIIPPESKVKITNMDVVSVDPPKIPTTNLATAHAFKNTTDLAKLASKIPKHILEYSRLIKATTLATSLELNHFYLHGKIDAKVESMIKESIAGTTMGYPIYTHQFEIKYVKLIRVSNKATIITRVYQYYDEADGYWKKKILCDIPLMVKENYFCYKLNDFYNKYNDLTEKTPVLQITYNIGLKNIKCMKESLLIKYQLLLRIFIQFIQEKLTEILPLKLILKLIYYTKNHYPEKCRS